VTRAVEAMQQWNPESPLLYQVWEVQGRACKNQALFPQAREWFAKAIESPQGRKTETAARAQLLTADTWVLEKNYENALDEYLKVDIGYDFPYWQSAALYHEGTCQESLGQPTAARKTYTRLLTQFPESEFAPKAKERLAALPKLAGSARGTQP
jgi:TolA-binding protein